ncbi:hypothetical protein L204_103479 [Cryptococcus depauperatus]|nr:hypothetical protein L204_01796 [Cryptococcus depauperatus CBS 7855]
MNIAALEKLKESLLGNTIAKAKLAKDHETLAAVTQELSPNSRNQAVTEAAIIVASLANAGPFALQPLIHSDTPFRLLHLIHHLTQVKRPDSPLPYLLRALRNILVSTADILWGHTWASNTDKQMVGTGLVEEDIVREVNRIRQIESQWKANASKSLELVFQPPHLFTLLSLLVSTDIQTILPIYQLYARLVAFGGHCEALVMWCPPITINSSCVTSGSRTDDVYDSVSHTTSWIVEHLISHISDFDEKGIARARIAKVTIAQLDLLSAIVKRCRTVALWTHDCLPSSPTNPLDNVRDKLLSFLEFLSHLICKSRPSMSLAALECATSIVKARKLDGSLSIAESSRINSIAKQLLTYIAHLLQLRNLENQVKIKLILASLVSDDPFLQQSAMELSIPQGLLQNLSYLFPPSSAIATNSYVRSLESTLLALASLAMSSDSVRVLISKYPDLPHSVSDNSKAGTQIFKVLKNSLCHENYGVRAASCQLSRALSRTISVVRTGMVDEGVGEEVIKLLIRETQHKRAKGLDESMLGEAVWTIEVAATATICNLIVDFSPFKRIMLYESNLQTIICLTHSSHTPLALNALWIIKNFLFHSDLQTKQFVMKSFTYRWLGDLVSPSVPDQLKVQGLQIIQNLIAKEHMADISRIADNIGENSSNHLTKSDGSEGLLELLAEILNKTKYNVDPEVEIASLYVLSNLALGNEKLRAAIVSHTAIVRILSDAINADLVDSQIPAILAFHHLILSSTKMRRSHQSTLDTLLPCIPKTRLKDLANNRTNLEAAQKSMDLLEEIDRQ